MNRPELLAPASFTTLKTAVQSGADAVYLGGSAFGARSYAENFDGEKLAEAIDYCHLRDVKVHLTLNTLVNDREIGDALRLAHFAADAGIDAFIVQDIGLAENLKSLGVPLHASTQLTVHNTEGAKFMKELGFERVVLSREMTKEEIRKVVTGCDIETEIFVHGALCMCYSGQCLMSSIIGGRSGNRGKCAQPCRLPYTLLRDGKPAKKGWLLSPKDLSLAENISDILSLGVTSLKIEGRMKGREYVAAAVSTFAECLSSGKNASPSQMNLLKNSFSRGGSFTVGRFGGDKNIMLTDKGNDDVYDIRNSEILQSLSPLCSDTVNLRRFPADVYIKAFVGQPIYAEMTARGFKASLTAGVAEQAQNRAADYDIVRRQLEKTGVYPIKLDNFSFDTDGNVFLALSDINEIRRRLSEDIINKITQSYKRHASLPTLPQVSAKPSRCVGATDVLISTVEQFEAISDKNFRNIFVPYTLNIAEKDGITTVFPDIIKEDDIGRIIKIIEDRRLTRIFTGNLGLIRFAHSKGISVFGSAALNIYNSRTCKFWHDRQLSGAVVSTELSLKNLREISAFLDLSVISYGRLPLMRTANCPIYGVLGKCTCGSGNFALLDRKNEVFPLVTEKESCITTVLNSKPVYMGDKQADLKGINQLLVFTDESPAQCRRITELYAKGEKFQADFTRGHFYRGAL